MSTDRAARAVDPSSVRPDPTAVRRVVLVDDHRTFADLLQFALHSTPSLDCVGVAYTPEEGLALIAGQRPHLVVMDYDFPNSAHNGVDVTAAITARFPDVRVLLLTGHADPDMLRRVEAAGARGILPKDGSLPDLINALENLSDSILLVPPSLLRESLSARLPDPLSAREHDVLDMLAVGLNAQHIADQLGISKNTCRGYIKSILLKLGAHSQLEAVSHARRMGLLAKR